MLLQDLRFAVRNLRKSPAFTLAAIATLALGVGATTAIFSTVNAALLRPLPYPDPDALYAVRTALTDGRVTTGLLSPIEVLRLNAPDLPIARAAGLLAQDATLLRNDGTPVRTKVYAVSEGFFELFGLPMTLGAVTHEQVVANGPPTVVVSYRVWRDIYGSDPAIVGKPIRFAEAATTIAAVAARDFDTPHGADFWFNIPLDPQGVGHTFEAFMRLKPGTRIERVQSEMAAVMAGVAKDFPASALNRVYVTRPLVDSIVGELGPILIIVLSATALLLVLACVNVTNLLLARGASRAREMAVRVALGAGRGRIIRQLLTESLLLATAGTVVGVVLAFAGLRALLAIGASKLPRLDAVSFDGRVLLFALGALAVSGVLVGFAPALRLARTDMKTLMNESGRSASGGRATARWLNAMIVAEIALAITLVAGAGWLIRSFSTLRSIDPGFVAESRLAFDLSFQGPGFRDAEKFLAAERGFFDKVKAIGGVTAVGATSNFPLRATPENSLFVTLRGEMLDQRQPKGSRQRVVTPGFFAAMGIRQLAGRDFTDDDRNGTERVAIVNRTFARRNVPGDPIGVKFSSGYPNIDPRSEVTIVGVVEDVRQKSLTDAAEPSFYTPHGQAPFRRMTVVVASRLENLAPLQTTIREEVRKLDPQMAVDFDRVSDLVAATIGRQQLGMTLMLLFGAAAVALAAVGIYGVIAYAVAERRGEVATRLALGATPANVFTLVLKQARTLAIVGTTIGLIVAYASGRLVSSQVYAVRASDPMVLGAAIVLVVGFTLLATMIPAYMASRVSPSRVLHGE